MLHYAHHILISELWYQLMIIQFKHICPLSLFPFKNQVHDFKKKKKNGNAKFKLVLDQCALEQNYYHSNLINRFIWGISQLIESWSNHHHCIMLMEMRLTFQSKQDVRHIKTAKKKKMWMMKWIIMDRYLWHYFSICHFLWK